MTVSQKKTKATVPATAAIVVVEAGTGEPFDVAMTRKLNPEMHRAMKVTTSERRVRVNTVARVQSHISQAVDSVE